MAARALGRTAWLLRTFVRCAGLGVAAAAGAKVYTCSEDLVVHQLSFGMMQNFQYLIESHGQAVAVDAAWDIDALKAYAKKRGLELVGGLYTHRHADHVGGQQRGFEAFPPLTGALELRPLPLWIGAGDLAGAAATCKVPEDSWRALGEAAALRPLPGAGAGLEVLALETPGHTEGGVSLLARTERLEGSKCPHGVLFTGDTLFPGSVGRTDLPGGSEEVLLRSLSRLSGLPPDTVVFPGHNYGSTRKSRLSQELASNAFLQRARRRFPPETLAPLPAAALAPPRPRAEEL